MLNGVQPEIYEAGYDQWEIELRNTKSKTFEKKSDFLLLFLSSTSLILDHAASNPKKFSKDLRRMIQNYMDQCGGKVILIGPESLEESIDQSSVFYQWGRQLRTCLENELNGMIQFYNIDPLIQSFGSKKWYSKKFLINAKLPCHPNCFPLFGLKIFQFIKSFIRRPVRLIVTDLDNTLWDGVVGEIGWKEVGLNPLEKGYAHLLYQKYLLGLKKAGVLLAISSKNTLEVAKKVFDKREEMILKFDDFVSHQINWEPKSKGINKILQELNLTETGTVFIDDSKFEREEVRSQLPNLIVPELPEEIEDWSPYLATSGIFGLGDIKAEDLNRNKMYEAERKRKKDASQHNSYEEFLQNSELKIFPEIACKNNFERILELIHKTNQFNLRTQRHSLQELQKFKDREETFFYCYRLKDKYSDYGIISVFIAENKFNYWNIDTWLMSCRAMGRGVENAVFNHFCTNAKKTAPKVLGEFIKTEKNSSVADLYKKMGFSPLNSQGKFEFIFGKSENPVAKLIQICLE